MVCQAFSHGDGLTDKVITDTVRFLLQNRLLFCCVVDDGHGIPINVARAEIETPIIGNLYLILRSVSIP